MSVAVIGSGVTGLTTAYLLLKEGVPVTIYEASPRQGGLASTVRADGFSFDLGPHELCTDNPELLDLLREICGEDLIYIEKNIAQYFQGSYLRFPFELADVLRNVSLTLSTKAVLEIAVSRFWNLLASPPNDSFKDWTRARFGKTLYELYFGPYTEKVWGMDPALLDSSVAADRISIDSIRDLLKKTIGFKYLGKNDHQRSHSEFRQGFHYVRRGIGSLHHHLRRRIEAMGGRFEFDRMLSGVRVVESKIDRLEFEDGRTAGGFSRVVSTIPLPSLVKIAMGAAGHECVARNPLPFRGLIFVFLRIDKPRVLDFHWTYYPGKEIPFQRGTEFVHFNAGMTPTGKTGVALEIASNPGDGVWDQPDDLLVKKCVATMTGLGQLREQDILGAEVLRIRNAYPLQVKDFSQRVDTLVSSLGSLTNLITIGRQGLFRYCNIDECMEMAMDVVPRIVAGEASIPNSTPGTWKGVALSGT